MARQLRGDDLAGIGIRTEMQFPPRASSLRTMLLDQPFARPAEPQTRAVHSRWMAAMFGWSRGNARISARRLNVEWSDMARLRPSSDGSDQSLGLTQCQ